MNRLFTKRLRRDVQKIPLKTFFFTCVLLVTLNTFANAQRKTITGTVISMFDNQPMPGVNIVIKETTRGTVTDASGKYSLEVEGAGSVLVFSYMGFLKEEVIDNGSATIDVSMTPNIETLGEVVVVGYGTQKRSDVTGSVVSVPRERLSNLPVTNVLQAIQGTVAGVNITQSTSVPGSQPSINIRGVRSLSANNDPYIILDGVPFPGTFNDLNVNDIESMEVLKDASAVAIYGTRGANGVILVTTKRGKVGKPVISYSAYAGPEVISHRLEPMNGQQYTQKYADYLAQRGETQVNPVPNSSELVNYNAGKQTNWIDEASQNGLIQDHNLSIAGGTEDFKFYIAGEYLKQKGVLKGYQFQRVSLRSNMDAKLTPWLTLGASMFFANNNNDGGRLNFSYATAMSPYGQLYNAQGDYEIFPMRPDLFFASPLIYLNMERVSRSNNLTGTFYTEVKPLFLKGLKYRLNGNYSLILGRYSAYSGRAVNDLVGTATNKNTEANNWTLENILSYEKDINQHHIDVTLLYSAQQSQRFNTGTVANTFINDALGYNNILAAQALRGSPNDLLGDTEFNNNGYTRSALLSQMARINYSYASKYLFTATARRDGSSVFGAEGNKYATFPSVAVGWNINKESFMSELPQIDQLKLRVSYGTTGNQAISPYGTFTTLTLAPYAYNGSTSNGVVASTLGSPKLKWESTTSLNIGLDFGVFDSRIRGTIEWYKSTAKDLLLKRKIPRVTGFPEVWDNIGQTENKGIEITLNTVNIEKENFSWETNFNISVNKNKIIKLYGDNKDDIGNRWFIGKPMNAIYDYKMQGVWQTGQDVSAQDPGAKPGDLKFADVSGASGVPDGTITSVDRMYLGTTLPKYIAGLSNTVKYKNISLSIFLQTVQGSLKNNPLLNREDYGGRINQPAEVTYWTAANGSNSRPALTYTNPRLYAYPSDNSFTRIKDISLSYSVPSTLLEKFKIGNMSVYVSGRNIYTFTKWIGWDPEQNWDSSTADALLENRLRTNYPNVASYIMGIKLSLL